jgi:hypothetical protein
LELLTLFVVPCSVLSCLPNPFSICKVVVEVLLRQFIHTMPSRTTPSVPAPQQRREFVHPQAGHAKKK